MSVARVRLEGFNDDHAQAVADLCRAEGWDHWEDVHAVGRALRAPGVTTLVALRADAVVGAIQVLADGEINWVVGMTIVAPSERDHGIGTALVSEAFARTGAKPLDLLTEGDGPRFYERFLGRRMAGLRLYPAR